MPEVIQTVDAAVLLWIQEVLRLPVLNQFFLFFTHLGDMGLLWLVLSAVLLCFRKTRRAGAAALLAMALGLLVTNVGLKPLVGRPRPYETVLGALPLYLEPDPLSFPSGHTCAAFAAATAWFRGLEKRWMGMLGLGLAALMGFSRLFVGVHYLSDVLTGMVIGVLCGLIAWLVVQWLWKEREGKLR